MSRDRSWDLQQIFTLPEGDNKYLWQIKLDYMENLHFLGDKFDFEQGFDSIRLDLMTWLVS